MIELVIVSRLLEYPDAALWQHQQEMFEALAGVRDHPFGDVDAGPARAMRRQLAADAPDAAAQFEDAVLGAQLKGGGDLPSGEAAGDLHDFLAGAAVHRGQRGLGRSRLVVPELLVGFEFHGRVKLSVAGCPGGHGTTRARRGPCRVVVNGRAGTVNSAVAPADNAKRILLLAGQAVLMAAVVAIFVLLAATRETGRASFIAAAVIVAVIAVLTVWRFRTVGEVEYREPFSS